MAARFHSSTPRSPLDIVNRIVGKAKRMSPADRARYLDRILAHLDSLLAPAATPAFERPTDDSEPDGADELTRWPDAQFRRATL
jgi:hypothetical protein